VTVTAVTKRPKAPRQASKESRRVKGDLGALPEWNLSDFYSGLDSPEIAGDLARADARCLAFEERYKGNLAALASGSQGGAALAAAMKLRDELRGKQVIAVMSGGNIDTATLTRVLEERHVAGALPARA